MSEKSQKVTAFIEEIIAVCRKHGMSISHEDSHGAFEIVDFDESLVEWLHFAFDETSESKSEKH